MYVSLRIYYFFKQYFKYIVNSIGRYVLCIVYYHRIEQSEP